MAIGITCVKGIMFICNLLFALTGILILTVGAIVQSNYHHYANFVGESIWTAPIILIIVGIAVFIIGFLGCCGAIKESACMILTFSTLIVIIFLAEIGAGIAGYIKHGELEGILMKEFNNTMEQYNNRAEYRDAWKLIQSELDCCGIQGPDDWEHVFHNTTLPPSCCSEIPTTTEDCTKQHAHPKGCINKLLLLLNSNIAILASVATTVAIVQLLTIIYACCLYRSFSRNYQTV